MKIFWLWRYFILRTSFSGLLSIGCLLKVFYPYKALWRSSIHRGRFKGLLSIGSLLKFFYSYKALIRFSIYRRSFILEYLFYFEDLLKVSHPRRLLSMKAFIHDYLLKDSCPRKPFEGILPTKARIKGFIHKFLLKISYPRRSFKDLISIVGPTEDFYKWRTFVDLLSIYVKGFYPWRPFEGLLFFDDCLKVQ